MEVSSFLDFSFPYDILMLLYRFNGNLKYWPQRDYGLGELDGYPICLSMWGHRTYGQNGSQYPHIFLGTGVMLI